MVAYAIADVWRVQATWSAVATRLKKRIDRARALALLLAIAVAVFGAGSATLAPSHSLAAGLSAAAAALGAGLLPLLRGASSGKVVRDWTRTRAVSEALKSELYVWLARSGPYREDVEGAVLRRRSGQIVEDAADLLPHHLQVTPPPRSLPEVHDAQSYFQVRVVGQVESYYRPMSRRLAARSTLARRVEVGIAILGALLGAAAASRGGGFATWIAVLTTVGTALAVHVAAARYDYQLVEFLRTANRLSRLHEDASAASAAELDALVLAAEEAILAENRGWMAELAKSPPRQ